MIRRSLFLAFAEKSAGTLIALLLMVVISRLLSPAEVGLYLVSSATVILIETFRDFGIASCIVQEPCLARRFLRSAFTLVVLLSVLLGGAVWLFAVPAARAYGTPELAPLFRIAAIGFLFAPISSIRLALLRREMAFGRVAAIGVTAAATGAAVTISLALLGAGPAALAWGSVAVAAVSAAGAFLARPEPDTFRPALADWRRMLPFGAWTSTVTLLGLLAETGPRLIIGRVLDLGAVGLFSRAVALTQLPDRLVIGTVQPVVLSDFSDRARRAEPLAPGYLTALEMIGTLQWSALACLALLAEPLVRLLLGPQWLEMVPLLRIVAIAGMALYPATLTFPALVASRRVRDMAVLNLVLVPVVLGVIWLASPHGLTAVALSLLVLNPVQGALMIWTVRRRLGFAWSALVPGILRAGGIAVAASAPSALLLVAVGPRPGPLLTVLAMTAAVPCWSAAVILLRSPLSAEVLRLAGRLRPALRKAPA